ncbi:MAG: MBL fold metallo-hydrolase [Eubacteriales bacterium]|nr:MBL fold metallo-hydrolase [Eubacteriales bacterium]
MIVKEMEKNFYRFIFGPRKKTKFGYNFYVLVDGNQALMIDTGFREHASEVKEYLAHKGITITKVIFTHFHLDHINGLNALDKVDIIGSDFYQEALDIYVDKEKQSFYQPTISIHDDYEFEFGGFRIKLMKSPGHAQCSMLTFINDKYLHVGDELMFSNEGLSVIPLVGKTKIKRQLNSLENLKNYAQYIILTSHGETNQDSNELLKQIDHRIKYLRAIDESQEKISFEQAIEGTGIDFLHPEWHETIYEL